MYTDGVNKALKRAMMANKLVPSFLKFKPPPVINVIVIFTKAGDHNTKKLMTTKMIILKDSFLLSFSALGGSLSSNEIQFQCHGHFDKHYDLKHENGD